MFMNNMPPAFILAAVIFLVPVSITKAQSEPKRAEHRKPKI